MLRLTARAKINWSLDILGIRSDGYHQMDMLMESVALADELTLLPAETLTLTAQGTAVPAGEDNLIVKAARALQTATDCHGGAQFVLTKRIPTGAGMGGGSADAAAALVGLNRLWNTGLTEAELRAIGLSVGADVPFMLGGGLARVGGIGEALSSARPVLQSIAGRGATMPAAVNTGGFFSLRFAQGRSPSRDRPRRNRAARP